MWFLTLLISNILHSVLKKYEEYFYLFYILNACFEAHNMMEFKGQMCH